LNPFKNVLKKYLIVTPLFYSFGDAGEQIHWALARANLLGKKLMIIPPMKFTQILLYSICNTELFKLEFGSAETKFEKVLKLFITIYVNVKFFIIRSVALVLKFKFNVRLPEHYYFPQYGIPVLWPDLFTNSSDINTYYKDPIIQSIETFPSPKINEKRELFGKKELEKFIGISQSKYVCLHVRDSGYFGDTGRRPYRNADINNYIPAVKLLIKNGFTVIRIGDISMNPCSYKNERFIESCFFKGKSELFDLFLIQNCEFYIGMQSGPLDIAVLFKKPVLLLNMYEWINGYPRKNCDRGYLKKILIPGVGKINTFKQRANLPFEYTDQTREYTKDEILFIENTPDEILNCTKEFLSDYNSGFQRKPDKNLVENQKIYKKRSGILLNELCNNPPFKNSFELPRLIYKNSSSSGYFY